MIKVSHLTKRFGAFTAVDDLSFSVNPGEIVGFLGPNGAGKSTTMKMITGFLEPSSGDVEIFNQSISENAIEIKKILGYLPEGAPAYDEMTVWQFLDFIADVRGFSGEAKKKRIRAVVKDVELDSVLDRSIENLSKGFKRRVGLAQALMHDPKILILDEPTDGLDPNQKHQVRQLIRNLSKDKIVIISTHILEEVTAVCNRAMIIASGRMLFDDTPQALEEMSRYHHAVTVHFESDIPDISFIEALSGVSSVEKSSGGSSVTAFPKAGQIIFHDVLNACENNKWAIDSIQMESGRLDEVFRTLTVGSAS